MKGFILRNYSPSPLASKSLQIRIDKVFYWSPRLANTCGLCKNSPSVQSGISLAWGSKIMSKKVVTELSQINSNAALVAGSVQPTTLSAASSNEELLHLYERVVESRSGPRDAEIFEKIRQWTFSDFSSPAHVFAGVSKAELDGWQTRNRINLSAGQIRPDPIDLQRGYAWGQMRMSASANRLHSDRPPPSANEVRLSWSTESR